MHTAFGPDPGDPWFLHGLWIVIVVVGCGSFLYTVLTLAFNHQDHRQWEKELEAMLHETRAALEDMERIKEEDEE